MKYLFLDIDGVLNHEDWYVHKLDPAVRAAFTEFWQDCFDPACVKRVNEILAATGANLVVSSSWKIDKRLGDYFAKVGLPTEFLTTPNIHREDEFGMPVWVDRGEEVEAFLKDHPCDTYVILDDDTDFLEDQMSHFVHCCPIFVEAYKEGHPGETGLTERKKLEAIKILNDLE